MRKSIERTSWSAPELPGDSPSLGQPVVFQLFSLVFHVEFPLEDSLPALPVELLFDCARMCFE